MNMLGTHKTQQQGTLAKLTKQCKIPEISFRYRFRNPAERNPRSQDFISLLVVVSVRMVTDGELSWGEAYLLEKGWGV